MKEESSWLNECMKVMPDVKRGRKVTISYARTPKNVLARVKGKVMMNREVDAVRLLLQGETSTRIRRRMPKEYVIHINENISRIPETALRQQVVQYLIIHELLQIINKDLLTLSKKYGKRKEKKIHTSQFDKELLTRYNKVRINGGMKPIRNHKALEEAVNKIVSKILPS